MADGDVSIALDVLPGSMAGITTAAAGFGQLIGSAAVFTKMVTKSTSAADSFAMTMTAGLGLVAVESANAAGEFERAMKVAQVVSNATARDMDVLTNKVNQFSVSYRMSIDKMTDGLQTLGRAGLKSVNTQIEVLETGLGAAKLSGLELNDVLEKIVQTTSLLGGEIKSTNFGSQVEDVSNKILATSMTAPINMNDVVQTLSFSGGTAAAGGINIQNPDALYDYLGAISSFAQKGVTGSIAGTALRAFFTKPAAQDKSVVDALGKIGLNPEDLWEKGGQRMKKVSDQIAIIHKAMDEAGMSQLDRIEIWGDVVGAKMGQQMMKLDESTIRDTAKDIRGMESSQELAQKSLQNYASDLEELKQQAAVVWRAIGEGFANIIDNKTLGDLSSLVKMVTGFLEFLSSGTGIFMIRTAIIGIISYITTRIGNLVNLFREMGSLLTSQIRNATSEAKQYNAEVGRSSSNFVKFGLTSSQAESLSNSTSRVSSSLKTSSDVLTEFLIKLNQITEIMRQMHLEIEAMTQLGMGAIDEQQYARHFGTGEDGFARAAYVNKKDFDSSRGNLTKAELVKISKQHGLSIEELEKIYNSKDFRSFAGKKGSTYDKYGFYSASDINAYLKSNNLGLKYSEGGYKNFIDSINQKISNMSDSMKKVEQSAANVEQSVARTSRRTNESNVADGYYKHIDNYKKNIVEDAEFSKGSRGFNSINLEEHGHNLSAEFEKSFADKEADPQKYAKAFSKEAVALYNSYEDKIIAAYREFTGKELEKKLKEIEADYEMTLTDMKAQLQRAIGGTASPVKKAFKEAYPDDINAATKFNSIDAEYQQNVGSLKGSIKTLNKKIEEKEKVSTRRHNALEEDYRQKMDDLKLLPSEEQDAQRIALMNEFNKKFDDLEADYEENVRPFIEDKEGRESELKKITSRKNANVANIDMDNHYYREFEDKNIEELIEKKNALKEEYNKLFIDDTNFHKLVYDAMLESVKIDEQTLSVSQEGMTSLLSANAEKIKSGNIDKVIGAVSRQRAGEIKGKATTKNNVPISPTSFMQMFKMLPQAMLSPENIKNLNDDEIAMFTGLQQKLNEGKVSFTDINSGDAFFDYNAYFKYMLYDEEFYNLFIEYYKFLNSYGISAQANIADTHEALGKAIEEHNKQIDKHQKSIPGLKSKIDRLKRDQKAIDKNLSMKREAREKLRAQKDKGIADTTVIANKKQLEELADKQTLDVFNGLMGARDELGKMGIIDKTAIPTVLQYVKGANIEDNILTKKAQEAIQNTTKSKKSKKSKAIDYSSEIQAKKDEIKKLEKELKTHQDNLEHASASYLFTKPTKEQEPIPFDITKAKQLGLTKNSSYQTLRDILQSSTDLSTLKQLQETGKFFADDFSFTKEVKEGIIKKLSAKKYAKNKEIQQFVKDLEENKIKNKKQLETALQAIYDQIEKEYNEKQSKTKSSTKAEDSKKAKQELAALKTKVTKKTNALKKAENDLKALEEKAKAQQTAQKESSLSFDAAIRTYIASLDAQIQEAEAIKNLLAQKEITPQMFQETLNQVGEELKTSIKSETDAGNIDEKIKGLDNEIKELNKKKTNLKKQLLDATNSLDVANRKGDSKRKLDVDEQTKKLTDLENKLGMRQNELLKAGGVSDILGTNFEEYTNLKQNAIRQAYSKYIQSPEAADVVKQAQQEEARLKQEIMNIDESIEKAIAKKGSYTMQHITHLVQTHYQDLQDALKYEEEQLVKTISKLGSENPTDSNTYIELNNALDSLRQVRKWQENLEKKKRADIEAMTNLAIDSTKPKSDVNVAGFRETDAVYEAQLQRSLTASGQSLDDGITQYHLEEYEMYKKVMENSNKRMQTFTQFMKQNFIRIKNEDGSISYVERGSEAAAARNFGALMGDNGPGVRYDPSTITSTNRSDARGFGFNFLSGMGIVNAAGYVRGADGTFNDKEYYKDLTTRDKLKLAGEKWARGGIYGYMLSPAIDAMKELPKGASKMQKGMTLAGGLFAGVSSFYGPLEVAMMGVNLAMQTYAELQQKYNEELSDAMSNLAEAQTNMDEAEEKYMEEYEKKNKKATQEQKDEAYLNAFYTKNNKNDELDSYRHKMYDKVTQISMNINKVATKLEDTFFGPAGQMNREVWSGIDEAWKDIFDNAEGHYQESRAKDLDSQKDLYTTEYGDLGAYGEEDWIEKLAHKINPEWYEETYAPHQTGSEQNLAKIQTDTMNEYKSATGDTIDNWNKSMEDWITDIEDFSDQTKFATQIAAGRLGGIDKTSPYSHAYESFFGNSDAVSAYYSFESDIRGNSLQKNLRMITAMNQMPEYFTKMQRMYWGTEPNKYGRLGLIQGKSKSKEDREEKILRNIMDHVGGITRNQAKQLLVLSTISQINQLVKDTIQPQLISLVESSFAASLSNSITAQNTGGGWTATEAVNAGVAVIAAQLATVVQAKVMEIQGYEAAAAGADLKDVYKVYDAQMAGNSLTPDKDGNVKIGDSVYTAKQARQLADIGKSGYTSYYTAFQEAMKQAGIETEEDIYGHSEELYDILKSGGQSALAQWDTIKKYGTWSGQQIINSKYGELLGEQVQEADSGTGGGSDSDKDKDANKNRKNWVNLAICNKKEIPKLNVNLFKKPPNFTILNRNFKLRDVNVNTADDAKSIQNAVKNSIIEIQNRSNPKIIQDDAAEYDPVNATEGNPIPTGTKKTE